MVFSRLEDDFAIVPSLWSFEIANTLVVAERRGRISDVDRQRAVESIMVLPIQIRSVPFESMLTSLLSLAQQQRLTAYDAAYLDLAIREGLRLATQDSDLRAAAVRVGVELVA